MIISDAGLDQPFRQARTANGFIDKAAPQDSLRRIYELACMAPTSMNTQPTRCVFLATPADRERGMPALSPTNVDKTRSAPVCVIVATDTRFYEHMSQIAHKPEAQAMFEGNAGMTSAMAIRNGTLGGSLSLFGRAGPGFGLRPDQQGGPGQGQRRVFSGWMLPEQPPHQSGLCGQEQVVRPQPAAQFRADLSGALRRRPIHRSNASQSSFFGRPS